MVSLPQSGESQFKFLLREVSSSHLVSNCASNIVIYDRRIHAEKQKKGKKKHNKIIMQYIVNDRKIIIHRGEGRLEKERKHHGKFFLASQRERKKEKEKVSSFFLYHLIKMMNFF